MISNLLLIKNQFITAILFIIVLLYKEFSGILRNNMEIIRNFQVKNGKMWNHYKNYCLIPQISVLLFYNRYDRFCKYRHLCHPLRGLFANCSFTRTTLSRGLGVITTKN